MEEMLRQLLEGQKEIQRVLKQHGEILQQHTRQLADLHEKQVQLDVRLENKVMSKINALFDAFELRGDQISNLQKYLEERLDTIALDVNYLLGKTARQETTLMELRRAK